LQTDPRSHYLRVLATLVEYFAANTSNLVQYASYRGIRQILSYGAPNVVI